MRQVYRRHPGRRRPAHGGLLSPGLPGLRRLLLSGGGDIAPHLFAAEDQGSQDIDYDRDMAELELLGAFLALGKPVLGIAGAIKSSTWDWGAP